ncbi:phage tail domain-containing protein [Lysinibacillus fusiformis]|uniref:phage tail domain-containing protein n=1 Tax=Lysinibacillus fusiformis TaxID=28031 RepID=UPI00263B620C|nr:phage tail domain-containing protein [Lysinibacillus fusiformis]MDC6268006.1 phage tail family protein [Lysinibacillus sphaericus]MDN4967504.1 phage tail family protein [Lysinibacillus fusiformis]
MDTLIEYSTGATLSLVQEGYITQDMLIRPIDQKASSVDVDGRPGVVRESVNHGTRVIILSIMFIASDELDFALRRDKLFSIFSDLEPFYIYEGRPTYKTSTYEFELPGQTWGENSQLPTNIEILKGKRYKVIRTNMNEVEQNGLIGKVDIEFETFQLPYAESAGTTLDDRTFDKEIWQTGQGLVAVDPATLKYVFKDETSFQIYNAGDVPLKTNLRDMLFEIEFWGSSTNLSIRNVTNGTQWQYNGSSNAEDVIKLETPTRFTKKENSIFKDTNKKVLILEPGWNTIQISGAAQFLILFRFKFYYK